MVDFGLSLKQSRNEETNIVDFILEPPLEIFAKFPSEEKIAKKGLSAQTKLLLSAEIDREKIRRMMKSRNSENALQDLTNTPKSKKKDVIPAMQAVIRPNEPKGFKNFIITILILFFYRNQEKRKASRPCSVYH